MGSEAQMSSRAKRRRVRALFPNSGRIFPIHPPSMYSSALDSRVRNLVIYLFKIITVAVFVLYTRQFIPFATSLCFIEFNSVFLHLRRLMRFHGISRSQFTYRLNLVALFGTYIALRFVLLVWLTGYFVYFRHKTYFSYFLLGFSGFVVLIAINLILFFRLWKTEFAVKTTMNGECRNGHVQEKHD